MTLSRAPAASLCGRVREEGCGCCCFCCCCLIVAWALSSEALSCCPLKTSYLPPNHPTAQYALLVAAAMAAAMGEAVQRLQALGGVQVEAFDFAPFAETAVLLYGAAFVAERYAGMCVCMHAYECIRARNVARLCRRLAVAASVAPRAATLDAGAVHLQSPRSLPPPPQASAPSWSRPRAHRRRPVPRLRRSRATTAC